MFYFLIYIKKQQYKIYIYQEELANQTTKLKQEFETILCESKTNDDEFNSKYELKLTNSSYKQRNKLFEHNGRVDSIDYTIFNRSQFICSGSCDTIYVWYVDNKKQIGNLSIKIDYIVQNFHNITIIVKVKKSFALRQLIILFVFGIIM
ncbi:hypothetical protein RFI_31506 [Reticulomyxa filosa]|uniref:Uncharacterized protein n=1 Tax=Reticulomyxa filosa TaxID=46433 RepID=X6LWB5_RETFI|nr:hypothetical protein RFI_31506 [Reticulomyxa filosa]|eukprot:ETO05889.1 hypothetical protein RFI_31506 [Reticulomyxa filosa]